MADALKVPAHVQPFVDVLGADLTERLVMELGGAPVYLSERPQGRSKAVDVLGVEKTIALARALGPGMVKIPNAKRWLAARLSSRSVAVYEIARRLHMSERAVRGWLNSHANQSQPSLFD